MEKTAKTRYMKWIEESANRQERDRRIEKLMGRSMDGFSEDYKKRSTDSIKTRFKDGKKLKKNGFGGFSDFQEAYDNRHGNVKDSRWDIKYHVTDKGHKDTGSAKDMIKKHQDRIPAFKEMKEEQRQIKKKVMDGKKQQILDRRNARIQAGPTPFSKLQETQSSIKNKVPSSTGKALSRNAKIGLGAGAGVLALGAGAYAYNKAKKKKEIEKKAMEVF